MTTGLYVLARWGPGAAKGGDRTMTLDADMTTGLMRWVSSGPGGGGREPRAGSRP